MAFVSLPMYAFRETAAAHSELGAALVSALARRGIAARWSEPHLPDHAALEAHWLSPQLALSQACGLPLVEALSVRVVPVGTWDWSGVTMRGRYRSVVVARPGFALRAPRAAINGWQSLSGWASLGVFLSEQGLVSSQTVPTGSHRASLAALRRGEADVAAIDAVTWSLAGRFWPHEVEGLLVIGRGPEIPALPLISRPGGPSPAVWKDVAEEALNAAPSVRGLGLTGYTPQTPADFDAVPALAARAEEALPRPAQLRRKE